MDFFGRQAESRRATRAFVLVFLIATILTVTALTLMTAAVVHAYLFVIDPILAGEQPFSEWAIAHWHALAAFGAVMLLFIGAACLYRMATLAEGGGQVARMLGATELGRDSNDPLHRRLINVTEEMAIAAGLPVPEIYVLEQEGGINAFAAGLAPENAAIAVTRGALEKLDRLELQGVVAHEFSHILNGDMRLNQRLIGLSYGILVLTLMGRSILYSARHRRSHRGRGELPAAFAIGVVLTVVGSVGLLASRLVKAAISRRREWLADASAVQFTRQPAGLAGALKKIGGYTSALSAVDGEEIAHMLFARGAAAFSGMFATHPPLADRIRALEPDFDESQLEAVRPEPARGAAGADVSASAMASPLAGAGTVLGSLARAGEEVSEERGAGKGGRADALLDHVGQIAPPETASALLEALPAELLEAARSHDSSFVLALAVALAREEAVRRRQLTLLESWIGCDRAELCRRLGERLATLDPTLRLPLLELATPALRQRPVEQIDFLFELIERVTSLGDEARLADYVLLRVLAAYLRRPSTPVARTSMSMREAIAGILTVVAAVGHEDSASAQAAYAAGLAIADGHGRDGVPPEPIPPYAGRELPDYRALDRCLEHVASLGPSERKRALEAVLATIVHDHVVQVAELELFRAIAASLGCPLPPIEALRKRVPSDAPARTDVAGARASHPESSGSRLTSSCSTAENSAAKRSTVN